MSAHPVDQLSAGGQYPHEDCGESCVASILVDAGHADSVHNIEWFDSREGDNPADGTGGQVHIDRLAAAGIPAHAVEGSVGDMVRAGQAKGLDRWMVAIYSNAAGSPYSGAGNFGHWVLVYAFDGQTYSVMQPVGGKLQTYTASQLEDNAQGYSIQVDVPIGAGIPATGGDEPMTPQERQQLATVLSLLIRNQYLSPHTVTRVSSLDEVNGTAQDMIARGFDTGAWAIVGSDEAKKAQGG
jgi:hypothetical protein